jgi:hypothetical protein
MYRKKKFGSKTYINHSKLQRAPETISSYFSTSVGSRSGFRIPIPQIQILIGIRNTSVVDPHWFRCGSGTGTSFLPLRIRIKGAKPIRIRHKKLNFFMKNILSVGT